MTDHNSNVLWELGVRQSFKNRTITIAELKTQMPFHFSHKGILFYDPHHLDDTDFETKFVSAIKDCITNPNSPDSPVLEAITGRGSLFEIIHRDEINRRMEALISECDYNLMVLNAIYLQIDKNQNNPEGRTYLTGRLLFSAFESLLVDRYIDEGSLFYLDIQKGFSNVSEINDQLRVWETNPEITEKWFLDNKRAFNAQYENCKRILTEEQKKLIKRSI